MVLKYYADINDKLVYDLLRQAGIKTDNQFIDFSDSSWQVFPDTGRSTGANIIFYQGGPIYHGTNFPVPVSWSSAESEYNASCTAGMALAPFRILIDEFLNKDLDTFTEEAPLVVLDSKYDMCMANNGKDTKDTSHIARITNFFRNS